MQKKRKKQKPKRIGAQEKRKRHLKHLYLKAFFITLAVCLVLLGAAYGAFLYLLGGLNRTQVDEENLAVNESVDEKVINVALFGLDSRNHDYTGRSDVIMIASVNSKTGKVKLVSVARDTYASIPGYQKTKINHAYAYGGPELAIRTLNENFGLDITDYVTVNFDSLAEVIDAMGGVEIEVSEAERQQINAYLLAGAPLRENGVVLLNGPQAVSYSRIRKIDSDDMRTSRQRRVLAALFEKAKAFNALEYPSYVRKFAPMVQTSLSNDEILKLASVGLKGKSLTLEQAAFPNEYIQAEGQRIGGAWFYVYDLAQAKDMLHEYLYQDISFAQYASSEDEEKD